MGCQLRLDGAMIRGESSSLSRLRSERDGHTVKQLSRRDHAVGRVAELAEVRGLEVQPIRFRVGVDLEGANSRRIVLLRH